MILTNKDIILSLIENCVVYNFCKHWVYVYLCEGDTHTYPHATGNPHLTSNEEWHWIEVLSLIQKLIQNNISLKNQMIHC